MDHPLPIVRWLCAALLAASLVTPACGGAQLGRPYPEPTTTLKVGYDREEDVLAKMGAPYRRTLDSRGRMLFTYLWADGEGAGQSCLVAFNEDGIVSLVDVAP
ncbi:MAG: hypothetical protein VX938_03085 [Myxococcota bacterium]|nr:hypothetical protein [Myxococcota bacterium]MEE2780181.1 hypothetical protein [Myxococcota bacterium]